MKRSKRKLTAAFFTITLLLMALVSGCGNGAASTKEGTEGLTYEPYEGSYVVTGYSGSDVNVVVPDTYNDIPVVKVGREVFYNSDIQSIVLGRNVQEIGSDVFDGASMLKSITITSEGINMGKIGGCKSLEEIRFSTDAYATYIRLEGCGTIASVAFPDGLQEISISNCENLSSVQLPNTVVTISAMANCPKLTSIDLPDSLTEIGSHAFKNSTSISELVIPASVTSVGSDAFFGFGSDQKIVITGSTDGWHDYRKELWGEGNTVPNVIMTGYWAGNCNAQIEYKNG